MKKLFGTDGIRGVANIYPLTIDICIKLAGAIREKSLPKTVLIGKPVQKRTGYRHPV